MAELYQLHLSEFIAIALILFTIDGIGIIFSNYIIDMRPTSKFSNYKIDNYESSSKEISD